jgi:putative transposase
MSARWCRECLEEAIKHHGAPEIINTDQGSQFSSPEFSAYFSSHEGLKFSMDGKRRAIDNIFIERFWRNIKYEKLYLEPSDNGLELYHKIKDYMKYYNQERPIRDWNIKGRWKCTGRPLSFLSSYKYF